jgi:hypothetical protein
LAGLGDLSVGFEQQAAHATFGQAAVEVEEGAVLVALMTGALGAPAGQEPFQQGGVNEVGRQLEGAQAVSFALAQSQGGEARDWALTVYIYLSYDGKPISVKRMRKCSSLPNRLLWS